MSNTVFISNRLNWIDWAKVFAISFVVFGHTPMEKGDFVQNFIVAFHMPFFFFISGYLTKKEYLNRETIKKYWRTLIIPYFCYNIIFYPYWIIRHIIDYPNSGWYDFVKPIIGTFMLQHETAYYESLNGVTWFLESLLVMKIILALSNKFKNGKDWIIILMASTSCLFIINENYRFVIDLPPVGFMRCFPFFFIGYFCKKKNLIIKEYQHKDVVLSVGCLAISLIAYNCFRNTSGIITYAILYWTTCLFAIFGMFSFCKLIDKVHSTIICNISIGTIVIMGLHKMYIGTTNYFLSLILNLEGEITYPLYVTIILTIVFIALEYPVIIYFKNKLPFMLGKSKIIKENHKEQIGC